MAHLGGPYEITEGQRAVFDMASGTDFPLAASGVVPTVEALDLDGAEGLVITPTDFFKYFKASIQADQGRVYVSAVNAMPPSVAPYRLDIHDKSGVSDYFTVRIVDPPKIVVQATHIQRMHMFGAGDSIELPNPDTNSTMVSYYFAETPPFPVSSDSTVVQVSRYTLLPVSNGTATIRWGHFRFQVSVDDRGQQPMRYDISRGMIVRYKISNIRNSSPPFLPAPPTVWEIADGTGTPAIEVVSDGVNISNSEIVIDSNRETGLYAGSVKIVEQRQRRHIIDRIPYGALYLVLFVYDFEGNQPNDTGLRPEQYGEIDVPPLNELINTRTGVAVKEYEDDVPAFPHRVERPLPNNFWESNQAPQRPPANYKELALGISSKSFITTDVSFEDVRKVNETETIEKIQGHYEFARRLAKRIAIRWPHIPKPGSDSEYLSGGDE